MRHEDLVGRRTAGRGRSGRINDPERTKSDILAVASRHFADHGFSGGRVDDIAKETNTSKRMIYYYFGSKDGLYEAVLERAYLDMRRIELEIDIERMDPLLALRQIVEFTFDHQYRNPWFARLVAIENIHHAAHLKQIPGIREHNESVLFQLEKLIRIGEERGVFRKGLKAVDMHWMISAFAVFNVVNNCTFSFLFPVDETVERQQSNRRAMAVDAVMGWCRA